MSWLFSQALVAEYSAGTCSAGEPFAQLSVMPTQHKFWHNDKPMELSDLSRFGLTCAALTADRGEALLKSCRADFLARMSVLPVPAMDSTANGQGFGGKWRELSVRFDRATSSWRTHRSLWDEDLSACSLTLPKWGSMRDGVLLERATSALPMRGNASGLLPTPTRSWGKKGVGLSGNKEKMRYAEAIVDRCHALIQEFGWRWPCNMLETMMGWPRGWSALKPLATDRFRLWQQRHGAF